MTDALLGVVFENLLSLVQNEFATISGIKGKAEKLSRTLELIKAVVEDAEEKQITSEPIKVWLQQLKDAVYVLDDILDECTIESLRLGGLSSWKPHNIKFRHEIGNRLKDITRRFDEIADSRNKFVLREGVRERPTDVAEWRQTSSIIPQPKVYGREDDKEKIVEFLLSQAPRSEFLSIYPIVGLGGIGKTTLTQMVYNDDRVRSNFEIKVWICVSENFSVKKILGSIIESITREVCDALNLDVIEGKVQELLQSKRFLLVLDDVWKRNQEMELGLSQDKWNHLKSVLSCASKGASILVSTRDMEVAAIMGTCQAHQLLGLSEDECWMLFKQYAFGPDKEEREELVAIGKDIVKKCGGSPLASQALGGLLRSRSEENEWIEVKESSLWNIPGENSILAALRLSYFHLSPTLRKCFTFCAIFPKDKRIMKKELIYLWIANEFISSRVNLEVEDVGNMIWKELYQKSFFQDMELNDYSGEISFKMHDLVHDLAQSLTGQECMTLEYDNITDLSKSTHHITVRYVFSLNKGAFKKAESLRTLYGLEHYSTELTGFFPTHRSLRVLRASSLNLSSLQKLIHLRYLELYELEIKTLPNSIYSLRKLKILKLISLRKLICLPKHLACLQNLRHLIIENCASLSSMCPNIGKLSCLRTLSTYIVSSKIGHSLSELRDLELTGNLRVADLQYVGSLFEAQEANLKAKKDLDFLHLSWVNGNKMKSCTTNPELVLEALQPHSNVKKLKIGQYQGLEFPRWISMLSNLVDLQLCGSDKCVQLSSLGRLPCLKKLEMWWMSNVQYIDDDDSYDGVEVRAFPSLERLILGWLPKIERLLKMERGEMFMFPHLSGLMIHYCQKLVLPYIPSLNCLSLTISTNELIRPVSSLTGLTHLTLSSGEEGLTSFPEGLLRNLACVRYLNICEFPELKELPHELFSLNALEDLTIHECPELESLPEQGWESIRSLRTLKIWGCTKLESLPEGLRHLTSLEHLSIKNCPALQDRCKEGTGEDWDKISHVPKLDIEGMF